MTEEKQQAVAWLRELVRDGADYVHFPIYRKVMSGVPLPPDRTEGALIDLGLIWYERKDDRRRTYWIDRERLENAA